MLPMRSIVLSKSKRWNRAVDRRNLQCAVLPIVEARRLRTPLVARPVRSLSVARYY